LYAFGHGLSYTRFSYANANVSTDNIDAGQNVTVSVEVRNDGQRAGDEVVQAYLDYPPGDALAPKRSLVGFQRVHLAPGESRRVSFQLDPRRLSSVDATGQRAVLPGEYGVFLGGGQPGDATGERAGFTIRGRQALPR
jgi:beta-glucosidase